VNVIHHVEESRKPEVIPTNEAAGLRIEVLPTLFGLYQLDF
jgi:hypothetical protein